MRCTNCGWMNTGSKPVCEKCNSPLQASAHKQGANNAPALPSTEPANPGNSSEVAGTAIGRKPVAPAWDAGATPSPAPTPVPVPQAKAPAPAENNMVLCPNPECNYPNSPNASRCVACGKPIGAAQPTPQPKNPGGTPKPTEPLPKEPEPVVIQQAAEMPENDHVNKTGMHTPGGRSKNIGATQNPWSIAKEGRFTLKPVPREGENFNVKLDFEGSTVELTRDNLEPRNNTITSKIQAVLEFRDGEWYLENKSAQQTTFIRVSGPVLLKKGDVILMGDRMFEFDC